MINIDIKKIFLLTLATTSFIFCSEEKTLDSSISTLHEQYEEFAQYVNNDDRYEYWTIIKELSEIELKTFKLKKDINHLTVKEIRSRFLLDLITLSTKLINFNNERIDEFQSIPQELNEAYIITSSEVTVLRKQVNDNQELLDIVIQIIENFIQKIDQEYLI